MDYLKSIFGTGDQKSPLSFDSKPSFSTESVQPSASSLVTAKQDVSSNIVTPGLSNNEKHTFVDMVTDTVTEAGAIIKHYITRVVPLEEGDCLSCKLIGVSVLWGAASFVVIQGRKAREKYTGFRRVTFFIHVGFLSSGLFVLGMARLLDKSIFEKDKGNKKSILEMTISDLKAIQQIFKTPSKDTTTREHPGD
ncbi:uncharacterized protein LOC121372718 [Gigantopelta aegis]|uniref:uncharacterized protein LOC121372718 n=1 Tax=Gigantopelta aegis TaxID=1735272 RepID=UPI001B8896D4|nr:uncharacterized protein LOC121372718 [Gigantopelta aegis]XP_041355129.1 uncharacterized protein LOC121372718 [Gigantopelta aegis]XP_041355130.1 uncharacterized protein LOC121372718 [Gigantopelta aegis]XP_041355131.1 uncharacterized protein LOC121372718 [Gigantopelta aegis]